MTPLLALLALRSGGAPPQSPALSAPGKILLIPLDSRPAAGQFATMIGNMAGVETRMPPYEALGRFTKAGDPDKIFDWLQNQDLTNVRAIVASSDMIAYGGLIASRENTVSLTLAQERLRRLIRFKRQSAPNVRLYVFAATMRLAPTATREAAPWRMNLAKYEEMKDRWERLRDPSGPATLARLRKKVPAERIAAYERTRARNFAVQKELLRLAMGPEIDYMIFGQDDAKPDGPHIQENAKLKRVVEQLRLGEKVFFCEGIDQHANVLMSRALLSTGERAWTPRVRVVYSDEAAKTRFAMYESKPIEASLEDQLHASGAELAKEGEPYDYSLFLNVPGRREEPFAAWVEALKSEVDQGFPVAVADIDFRSDGTSDRAVYDALIENGRAMKLLSYAGWNTAGNTMGTTIPAANVYLWARRAGGDPLAREVAQREFLLHRLVDDYDYHRFTRPEANRMLDRLAGSRDEAYGAPFKTVNEFVQRDMQTRVQEVFDTQFKDRRFFAGTGQWMFHELGPVRVFLPWPRAYEVRVEFHLKPEPYEPASGR